MKLEILTPEKLLYEGEVDSIKVPGKKGPFTVLHNHAPIISTLEMGQIKIVSRTQANEIIDITGGIIEVKKNHIIILADMA